MKLTHEEWSVIQYLHGKGFSASAIEGEVKVAESTVRYWIGRQFYKKDRPVQPPSKEVLRRMKLRKARREIVESLLHTTVFRIGSISSPKIKKTRVRFSEIREYDSPAKIARHINIDPWLKKRIGGETTSASTVRRDLLAMGLKAYKCRRGPRLTDRQKEYRVEFCEKILKRPELLPLYAFTDEKWFDSDDAPRFHWAKKGERIPTRIKEKNGPKVMVWGIIAKGFKRLVRVPPREDGKGCIKVDSEAYVSLVKQPLLEMKDVGRLLQQDNAPSHVSEYTHRYFSALQIRMMPEKWPPYSPDLSPIETLWAILARRVANRGPWGEEQLWEFVEEEWGKLEDSTVDGLVEEFAARCRACVAAKGEVVTAAMTRAAQGKSARVRGYPPVQ